MEILKGGDYFKMLIAIAFPPIHYNIPAGHFKTKPSPIHHTTVKFLKCLWVEQEGGASNLTQPTLTAITLIAMEIDQRISYSISYLEICIYP